MRIGSGAAGWALVLLGLTAAAAWKLEYLGSGLAPIVAASIAVMLGAIIASSPVNGAELGIQRIYFAVFLLFHGGLIWPLALGKPPFFLSETDQYWFDEQLVGDASFLLSLFIVCCVIGSAGLAAGVARSLRWNDRNRAGTGREYSEGPSLLATGILSLAVVAWFILAISGGVSLRAGNYIQFLDSTTGLEPYAYLAIGVGMAMLGPAKGPYMSFGLAFFVAFAIVAFPLGLRGEVIVPLACFLLTWSRSRRRRPRWVILWAVLIAGLFVGSFVRTIRVGATADRIDVVTALEGVSEMGYSIRPVLLVLDYLSAGGEQVGIATYLNPVARLIGVDSLAGVPGAADDFAAFNSFVVATAGNIGGSVVAEAFRAGGYFALICVGLLVGALLGGLDRLPLTPAGLVLFGGSAYILLVWVRNNFVPVPFQIALVLAVVVAVKTIDSTRTPRSIKNSV